MEWKQLTRRTEQPKLAWLMRALHEVGVPSRLNGASFHAPIMEVPAEHFSKAWAVLAPVDDLSDDDPLFRDEAAACPWWTSRDVTQHGLPDLVAGLGLWSNKLRRSIAGGASCVPEGHDDKDCPLAIGLIAACPANLWSICRPMVRVEVHGIALATQLGFVEADALTRARGLIEAAALVREELSHPVEPIRLMITLLHVVAQRITDGRFGSTLRRFCRRPAIDLMRDLLQDTRWHRGSLYPRWVELSVGDLADRAAVSAAPLN